jgi:hypothetical protein
VVNRDWVKREREERGAVGLGARHAAKLAGGGAALKKRGDSPWVFVSPGEKSDENC